MPPGANDRASRARPVADAPVAALVADAEDVAKAWLLELVAAGPLAGAASLPLDAFSREAPSLGAAPAVAEPEPAPEPEPEPAVRVADLRVPIVRPARPAGDDLAPPRVADGDPHTHLAARAAEFVQDGRPFAVLLVELDGVETLLATQDDRDVALAVEAAERALEDLARPGDAIRREAPGRLWLTLPGAGPAGARALALPAAAAVE